MTASARRSWATLRGNAGCNSAFLLPHHNTRTSPRALSASRHRHVVFSRSVRSLPCPVRRCGCGCNRPAAGRKSCHRRSHSLLPVSPFDDGVDCRLGKILDEPRSGAALEQGSPRFHGWNLMPSTLEAFCVTAVKRKTSTSVRAALTTQASRLNDGDDQPVGQPEGISACQRAEKSGAVIYESSSTLPL